MAFVVNGDMAIEIPILDTTELAELLGVMAGQVAELSKSPGPSTEGEGA